MLAEPVRLQLSGKESFSVDSECSTALSSFTLEDEVPEHDAKPAKGETCIIFDWDDTLLPTSFIEDAARMCAPNCASPTLLQNAARVRGFAGNSRAARSAKRHVSRGLPQNFPCYAAIQQHAQLVEEVLRGAKEAADRVAIVTLSARPWVFESADQYLPGLDMAELLKELQIPVYYAPEHTQATDDTQDPHVNMKRNAMQEFLHLFGDTVREDALNVISIGDSLVEKEAAQATARLAEDCGRPSMCKTIKLIGDPSLKQLRDELSMLKEHLPTLCTVPKELDIHVQSPEDLEAQLAALSA